MRPLKPQQYEVYQYIADYIEHHQYSPIQSDIAQALALEMHEVDQIIWDLRDRGYLTYLNHGSRMMYLTAIRPISPQERVKRDGPLNPPEQSLQRKKIHQFIADYVEEHKYPPSLREIAAGVKIASTSTVKYHLTAMRDQGYVTFVPGRARSLTLTERPFILEDCEQQADSA